MVKHQLQFAYDIYQEYKASVLSSGGNNTKHTESSKRSDKGKRVWINGNLVK